MKKLFALLLVLVTVLALAACGGNGGSKKEEPVTGNKIPDVFGINYADAITILEAESFEVTAIELDPATLPSHYHCHMGNAVMDTVIKIDDYIRDGNGHIILNSSYCSDGMHSEDNTLVIYYAKTDYVYIEETAESNTPETQAATPEETTPPTTAPQATEKNETLGSDFKAAMDSYEEFMNKYVEFMKKFNKNPSDLSLLTDYANFMSDYAEYVESFEKWEDEDLNSAELAYYIDVQARVSKKLLEVI